MSTLLVDQSADSLLNCYSNNSFNFNFKSEV